MYLETCCWPVLLQPKQHDSNLRALEREFVREKSPDTKNIVHLPLAALHGQLIALQKLCNSIDASHLAEGIVGAKR
jgi:hypothetical protein